MRNTFKGVAAILPGYLFEVRLTYPEAFFSAEQMSSGRIVAQVRAAIPAPVSFTLDTDDGSIERCENALALRMSPTQTAALGSGIAVWDFVRIAENGTQRPIPGRWLWPVSLTVTRDIGQGEPGAGPATVWPTAAAATFELPSYDGNVELVTTVVSGPEGRSLYVTGAAPSPSFGKVGDSSINYLTGDVYTRTTEGWGDPVANFYGGAIAAAQAAADAAEATAGDRVATGLDRIATGQDRTATGLDRNATAADRIATSQDRVATSQDAAATAVDRAQTGLDRSAVSANAETTAADRIQTGLDRIATGQDAQAAANDRVQTGLDRIQTGADRLATAQDAEATAADRVQTGLDRAATGNDAIATAADRVQTGLDRTATVAAAAVVSPIAAEIQMVAVVSAEVVVVAENIATIEDAAESLTSIQTAMLQMATAYAESQHRYIDAFTYT